MREVTNDTVNNFLNGVNCSIGNTTVTVNGNETNLLLFGNTIATKIGDKIQITNKGYFTNTTKERLNGLPNVKIIQKQKKWFLNGKEWDGKLIEI
jgi:hypothetical protein